MIKEELIRIVDNAFNAGEIESQITEQESVDARKEILINQKLRELVEKRMKQTEERCGYGVKPEEISNIYIELKSLLDEAKK